jgi:hypothetical protein
MESSFFQKPCLTQLLASGKIFHPEFLKWLFLVLRMQLNACLSPILHKFPAIIFTKQQQQNSSICVFDVVWSSSNDRKKVVQLLFCCSLVFLTSTFYVNFCTTLRKFVVSLCWYLYKTKDFLLFIHTNLTTVV